jgi:hemolysin III
MDLVKDSKAGAREMTQEISAPVKGVSFATSPPTSQPHILDGRLNNLIQWYSPPRRPYTRRELIADRCVNVLGAIAAWFAALLLGFTSFASKDPAIKQICFWVHGAGLITMLNCSALYHYWAWDWKNAKRLLSLDHIGISAMIIGCYAPVMQQCGCYRVLAFVSILGLSVFPLEMFRLWQDSHLAHGDHSPTWAPVDILHIIRYLVMGWACLLVVPTMLHAIPSMALCTMVGGGLLYTSGVFFFVRQKLEFHLAIWHTAVLLASIFFYSANLLVLVGTPASSLQL